MHVPLYEDANFASGADESVTMDNDVCAATDVYPTVDKVTTGVDIDVLSYSGADLEGLAYLGTGVVSYAILDTDADLFPLPLDSCVCVVVGVVEV